MCICVPRVAERRSKDSMWYSRAWVRTKGFAKEEQMGGKTVMMGTLVAPRGYCTAPLPPYPSPAPAHSSSSRLRPEHPRCFELPRPGPESQGVCLSCPFQVAHAPCHRPERLQDRHPPQGHRKHSHLSPRCHPLCYLPSPPHRPPSACSSRQPPRPVMHAPAPHSNAGKPENPPGGG